MRFDNSIVNDEYTVGTTSLPMQAVPFIPMLWALVGICYKGAEDPGLISVHNQWLNLPDCIIGKYDYIQVPPPILYESLQCISAEAVSMNPTAWTYSNPSNINTRNA